MADAAIWGVFWQLRLQLAYQLLWLIHTHTNTAEILLVFLKTHKILLHSRGIEIIHSVSDTYTMFVWECLCAAVPGPFMMDLCQSLNNASNI